MKTEIKCLMFINILFCFSLFFITSNTYAREVTIINNSPWLVHVSSDGGSCARLKQGIAINSKATGKITTEKYSSNWTCAFRSNYSAIIRIRAEGTDTKGWFGIESNRIEWRGGEGEVKRFETHGNDKISFK